MPNELTISQLSKVIDMPPRTLRYAVQKGALPARRKGMRRFVVSLADAERFAGKPLSGNIGNIDNNSVVVEARAS